MGIADIQNTDLLRSFNEEGHYYTSYPSLNHWTEDFTEEEYREALGKLRDPCHLYIHIPFCAKLCWYCICNIIISNDREKIQYFLDHLLKEIDLLKPCRPEISEIQFGGGTPSHLDQKQFSQLCSKLNTLTDLKSLEEVAMEIDPRTVTQSDLRHYASLGVTRISFGIQDFDPKVQKAINRIQPYEMIEELLTPEIRKLFTGVNFDLLYGLPLQTHQTIRETIEKVKRFSPDRITLLKYCHAPDLRRHMKLIKEPDLPPKDDLPVMFVNIIESLMAAKYEWVGLDHFAKKGDSLGQAAINKTVGRTFNGFTPGRVKDMIGLGPTSTAAFGRTYAQSQYDLNDYYKAVNRGEFPILRGYTLTPDDLVRREVIFSLMCNQRVDFKAIGEKHGIEYKSYFKAELSKLGGDLCSMDNGVLTTTAYGRVLLRNLCKMFDRKDVEPKHHKIAQKSMIRVSA